ncbi:MAG: winged helix-turn-helix transcriptional regulator [Candidatus Hydrogenedentes bacterium]|nr:winged helix-turn-helix transcriptional regulator [Candidatus Hydrogenedentota bacterium]
MMDTMPKHDLGSVLFGRTRQAVLALLFAHLDEAFYVRQIARMAGVGMGALQRELTQLLDAGIIVRRVQGNQVHYQVNERCPVFPELRSLLLKTVGIAATLREALRPVGDVRLAFIYGSVASSRENRSSDVDVVVVGPVTFAEVSKALVSAEDKLAREVNPIVYAEQEFTQRVKSRDGFLFSVVEGPKVFLVGTEDELARLAA